MWRYMEPSEPPTGKSVTVLDIQGMGMTSVGGEVLDFIKRASKFTGAHYPERALHIFILNAPWYFSGVWKMIKGFIDPVSEL